MPTEVTAFYVVAEALTNVARSSRATHAWVEVAQTSDELHVEIRDDGRGAADPQRGSGILGLQDRVRALDGRWAFESPPGGGTRIDVWLPCE
jgi:signal transduction histidine kinase